MPADGEGATGRRRTAKGLATRDRIVAAAADLMHRQGAEHTTLDEVIAASGTGKSQMYHYFADKDELVEAVAARQVERVLADQDPFFRDLHTMQGFERWRDAVVANNRKSRGAYGCPLGSLSSELADRSDAVRRRAADGFAAWEGHLRAGLERMQESGELSATADPARLALGLLAALEGGYVLAQARRDTESLGVALDVALDHVRAHVTPGSAP